MSADKMAISERMRRVKSSGTSIEKKMEGILSGLSIPYEKQPKLTGKPDFLVSGSRLLIFCDSSFWHGRRKREVSGAAFKRNRMFWVSKLRQNKKRDLRTNRLLKKQGWRVIRFWDDEILKHREEVARKLRWFIEDEREKPVAVDLFCGAGGLSLGLERAGFSVAAGIEIDEEIGKTYKANHPNTKLIPKDIKQVTGDEILEMAGKSKIDLIAGCPPCQGFSSLTSKYRKEDSRNVLILEMARLIERLKPSMVMLENVAGLANRGSKLLNEFVSRLEAMGYDVNKDVLQMADYGIPQSRRRLVLLAGMGFRIEFPQRTHSRTGDKEKKLKPWVKLEEVIKEMRNPVTLAESFERGGPQKFNWHVVSELKEISRKRMGALAAGNNRFSLPRELKPKCHVNNKKGFSNVYGRLSWDKTSPTITSGVTTPAMGRFGHPDELRTLSIREAAIIQTFPNNYRFKTNYMKTARELVGNALPPRFAEQAGMECLRALGQRIEAVRGKTT